MKRSREYAVVYDITSDHERNRVSKVLKGFGFRVQKSVFECRLDKKGRRDLIRKLDRLNLKTGFIKIYRIEHQAGITVIGHVPEAEIDDNNSAYIL